MLTLNDQDGKYVVVLSATKDQSMLLLNYGGGKSSASLSAGDNYSYLNLNDERGQLRAELSHAKDRLSIAIADSGPPRTIHRGWEDGPVLALYGDEYKTLWKAPN